MDYSFLKQGVKCIATSGDVDKDTIQLYFPNVMIVSWSPRIDCLITNQENSWKIREAKRLKVPIFPWIPPKTDNRLWVDKYAPSSAKDIIGNDLGCKEIYNWLLRWKTGASMDKRGILITGPPGIGKTTSAHLLAKYCDFNIIELNASCVRSGQAIKELFSEAAQSSHIGAKRVIIMDEVDGMSSGDRGGISILANLLKTCSFPVICIANDRGSPKLRPLNSVCEEIKFTRPHKSTIVKVLMNSVVKQEKLTITKSQLEEVCEQNGNDIRQILNYLQMRCGSLKDDIHRLDLWSATRRVYDTSNDIVNRLDGTYYDTSMVPLMIQEGYLTACDKTRYDVIDKLQACAKSADYLSCFDLIDTRIHTKQSWSLLPAAMTMVCATASSTRGCAPHIVFPSYLGKMSKKGKHLRMYNEISQNTQLNRIYDLVEIYRKRLIRFNNVDDICNELVNLKLTRDIMFESLPETLFSGDSFTISTKLKTEVTKKWKKLYPENIKDTKYTDDEVSEDEDENNIIYT